MSLNSEHNNVQLYWVEKDRTPKYLSFSKTKLGREIRRSNIGMDE